MTKITVAYVLLGFCTLGCAVKKTIESAVKSTSTEERPFDGEWEVVSAIFLKSTYEGIPIDGGKGVNVSIRKDSYTWDGEERCRKGNTVVPVENKGKHFQMNPPVFTHSVMPFVLIPKFGDDCKLSGNAALPISKSFYFPRTEYRVVCSTELDSRKLPNEYMLLDENTLLGWNGDSRYFCLKRRDARA